MGLIEQLTTQLGISTDQAQGATGAILKSDKANLSGVDLGSFAQSIPEAEQMVETAESAESGSGGGGMMGALSGLAGSVGGALGGSTLGSMAGLTSLFGKLGLGPDAIAKVVQTVVGFLRDKDPALAEKLEGLFSGT